MNEDIKKLRAKVKHYEESLKLCLGPESPLSPIMKGVVRGFFTPPKTDWHEGPKCDALYEDQECANVDA